MRDVDEVVDVHGSLSQVCQRDAATDAEGAAGQGGACRVGAVDLQGEGAAGACCFDGLGEVECGQVACVWGADGEDAGDGEAPHKAAAGDGTIDLQGPRSGAAEGEGVEGSDGREGLRIWVLALEGDWSLHEGEVGEVPVDVLLCNGRETVLERDAVQHSCEVACDVAVAI